MCSSTAGGAQLDGGLDLPGVGIDEQSDLDARVAAARQRLGDPVALAGHVEASLGRQLLAALGHERHLVGPDLQGQGDHAGLDGQLQVEPDLHGLPQQAQVAVLDVPAVFAEMDRDHVGPAQLGEHGRPDRVGLAPAADLTKRGDMIDIDTQARHGRVSPQMTDAARGQLMDGRDRRLPRGGRRPGAGVTTGRSGDLARTKVRAGPTANATRPLRPEPSPSTATIRPRPYSG